MNGATAFVKEQLWRAYETWCEHDGGIATEGALSTNAAGTGEHTRAWPGARDEFDESIVIEVG